MKLSILASLVLFPALVIAGEGHDIGNGGGAWVCRTRAGAIQWIQLVDAFEALEHRLVPEAYTGTEREIVDRVMMKLLRADRALFEALSPEVERLNALADAPPAVTRTTARLEVIDDSRFWLRPEDGRCAGGTLGREPEQVVNYRDDGTVWVQNALFLALPVAERAALVLHEAVYADRRTRLGDRDSVLSRRVVGLLMSNLPVGVLAGRLAQVRGGNGAAEMRFVSIPAGSFMMGTSIWDPRHPNEAYFRANVEAFELQTTEVTQAQFYRVMGTNPSQSKRRELCPGSFREIDGVPMCADFPVENVSDREIYDFSVRLMQAPGNRFDYRLPSEIEWEYAVRGGSSTDYSYGNEAGSLSSYGIFHGNSVGHPAAVATKLPNVWGLYDMHGNVAEWTSSYYEDNAQMGAAIVSGPRVVIRGGAWDSPADGLRSAWRHYLNTGFRAPNTGFRLVRTPR